MYVRIKTYVTKEKWANEFSFGPMEHTVFKCHLRIDLFYLICYLSFLLFTEKLIFSFFLAYLEEKIRRIQLTEKKIVYSLFAEVKVISTVRRIYYHY